MSIRLKNEKKKIIDFYTNKFICSIIHEEYNLSTTFLIRIFVLHNEKFLDIKFVYSSEYPFRTPRVYIKDIKYNKLLQSIIQDESIKKYIYYPQNRYFHSFCHCCHSILCNDHWCPVLNTCDIMVEIVDNYLSLLRYIEMIYVKKILEQHIGIFDITRIVWSFI